MNQERYWLKGLKIGAMLGIAGTIILFFVLIIIENDTGVTFSLSTITKLLESLFTFFIFFGFGAIATAFAGGVIGSVYGMYKNRGNREIIKKTAAEEADYLKLLLIIIFIVVVFLYILPLVGGLFGNLLLLIIS